MIQSTFRVAYFSLTVSGNFALPNLFLLYYLAAMQDYEIIFSISVPLTKCRSLLQILIYHCSAISTYSKKAQVILHLCWYVRETKFVLGPVFYRILSFLCCVHLQTHHSTILLCWLLLTVRCFHLNAFILLTHRKTVSRNFQHYAILPAILEPQ